MPAFSAELTTATTFPHEGPAVERAFVVLGERRSPDRPRRAKGDGGSYDQRFRLVTLGVDEIRDGLERRLSEDERLELAAEQHI